jgi:hypothetical protein
MFGELVKEPQAPSTVDVGRAVRDGRRRRRTRRLLECGAVVAAAGLILGGVGLLGGRTPRPVTVAAPDRFDPMTRYADFGWLPSRLGERSVFIQPEHLTLEASVPGDGDPRSVVRRVAQTLRVGVNEPLRVPFRAGFVPPGLRPAGSIERGDPGSARWSVNINLQARTPSADGNKPRRSAIAAIPAASHFPMDRSEPLNTNPGELHQMRDRRVPSDPVLRKV